MNTAGVSAAIAGGGFLLTIATILFVAGRYQGTVTTRLDDIERRLTSIEEWLDRLGVTVLRRSDLRSRKGQ